MEFEKCELEQKTVYGVAGNSGDKTIARDIPRLSGVFYSALGEKRVLPFYVVCSGYDEKTGGFELFVGGDKNADKLQSLTLEKGTYVRTTVRPKLGFLWGPAIGEAKREFYTKWLPQSGLTAKNLEYEYHTQKSLGLRASIDILFAVK